MAQQVVYNGTGRRKDSVARVFLVPGTGKITINKKSAEEYLPFANLILDLKQPLVMTETEDPDFRDVLKRAGMLTRDSRMKERKKPGLKKARKASQFSKR